MKSFRQYLSKEPIDQALVEDIKELIFLYAHGDELITEGYFDNDSEILSEGVKKILKKGNDLINKGATKLNIKREKGLLSYLRSAGKGVAKLVVAAVKGDGEKARGVINSVKREDLLDFFLKLDMGLAHALSFPIHTIDAWTGFEIWKAMEAKAKGVTVIGQKVVDAITTVKNDVVKIIMDKKRVLRYKNFLNIMQKDVQSSISVK